MKSSMSSLICNSSSSTFRPFDARKYRKNSNWQLGYLNQIRKNIQLWTAPYSTTMAQQQEQLLLPHYSIKNMYTWVQVAGNFYFSSKCMRWIYKCAMFSCILIFLCTGIFKSVFVRFVFDISALASKNLSNQKISIKCPPKI